MSNSYDACGEIRGRLQCAIDLLNDYSDHPEKALESWAAPDAIQDIPRVLPRTRALGDGGRQRPSEIDGCVWRDGRCMMVARL